MSVDAEKYVEIPLKLYVTVPQVPKEGYDKNFPLAFMTYFDKDDKSFQSRKETGDSWAKSTRIDEQTRRYVGEPLAGIANFYDNVPIKNVSIFDYTSRWSTSNKLLEVKDPRGFSLQVSIECMCDIIKDCTLVKGIIQDELIWGRRNGQNVLIPVDSELYRLSMEQKPRRSKLQN